MTFSNYNKVIEYIDKEASIEQILELKILSNKNLNVVRVITTDDKFDSILDLSLSDEEKNIIVNYATKVIQEDKYRKEKENNINEEDDE